ncbi:MAG TPA: biopolymer transporter ExbD [Sedimentisphaerales bacterium]|nr:biopolymer transporter ExbD [Sedimentisphaerales bacterium]
MKNHSMESGILARLNNSQRHRFSLRMAPMIDMIFLLLIFFFVAAKWRPAEDFLPFQLSAAHARNISIGKPEPLIIHISSTQTGCKVQIGELHTVRIENENIEANLAVLIETMNKCLLAQKRFAADPIEIVCAPEVKWDHLAKIYNMFFGAGLTDITFRMTE